MATKFIPADKFKTYRPDEERVASLLRKPASLEVLIELANINPMDLD